MKAGAANRPSVPPYSVRHRMANIRVMLRRGTTLLTLGIVGIMASWILLIVLYVLLSFPLDRNMIVMATLAGVLAGILAYWLSGPISAGAGRVFQGESYKHRQRLADFARHSSAPDTSRQVLELIRQAFNCQYIQMLYRDGEGFSAIDAPSLKIKADSPIVQYFNKGGIMLQAEDFERLPELREISEGEKNIIRGSGTHLLIPFRGGDDLVAMLAIGKAGTGRYTPEDIKLLKTVSERAVSAVEKDYQNIRLKRDEEELRVITRSAGILTSSLDITGIYEAFIRELRNLVDIGWSALLFIEDNGLYCIASYPTEGIWAAGDHYPLDELAMPELITGRKAVFEIDLSREDRFAIGLSRYGVRSICCLPLMVRDEVLGSLVIASPQANAYQPGQIALLAQLAGQVATPVSNARLYAKTKEMARIDQLTGLLNRRSFDETIASEISRCSRYGGVFSVIILDIDSFKAYNDNYGHLAGDRILRRVGGIIKSAIRIVDHAFRYGGDEFGILLPQTSLNAAYEVAERIRGQVAQRIAGEAGFGIPVTVCLGLATWPVDGISQNEVIAASDSALYEAKRGGGNLARCASGTSLPLSDVIARLGDSQENKVLSTIYALWSRIDGGAHHGHSERVSEYARGLAKAINMGQEDLTRVETCALLHDIGKIVISDDVLNKRGELTSAEWDLIKTHPQLGANIADICRLDDCAPGILHHHERYDGNGYPSGLKGEAIPMEARILAIADAFAAMTSDRSYSASLTPEDALEEIKHGAGNQFDPHLAEVFISIFSNREMTKQT